MEAAIEITEPPVVIVAGKVHRARRNVRWFGSLVERNNLATNGEHTIETTFGGRILFGLESLSLLD